MAPSLAVWQGLDTFVGGACCIKLNSRGPRKILSVDYDELAQGETIPFPSITGTGTANKLAAERADTAIVAVLTPICVEKFTQSGEAIANLAALRKISSSWEQGNFIEKGGWATRPGATSADYVLARACAEKLVQAKSAAQ